MAPILLILALLEVLLPCAHTFAGVVGISRPTRSLSPSLKAGAHRVHTLGLSGASLTTDRTGGRRSTKRAKGVFMGAEEVGAGDIYYRCINIPVSTTLVCNVR